jgi:capsular exopolysaccharide synthesis family protein
MAVVRDYYIGGFVDAEQLESAVGVPVLASIPVYRPRDRKPVESAIFSDPLSGYAESIRRVRLGIEAFAQDSGCLCVFVTSTLPEEGKTTIALALARAFALTGRKTLLIDADLRHPSAGKLASVRAGYTLTQYLTGEVPEDDVSKLVSEPEPETGLSLLFGSDVRIGATDVPLMSERFRGLISRARADFDVVVLDTSPVGLVVDPQIIARNADVGLYVVRYASTNQNAVRESLKQLRSEAQVVYGVLNQVASNTTLDSGYGYYGQPRSMA